MEKMIQYHVCQCPVCGFQSYQIFPIQHYEAGSSGRRTYKCPNCGIELEE